VPEPEAKEPETSLPPSRALTGKTAQAMLWFLIFCLIAGLSAHLDPRQLTAGLRYQPAQGVSWFAAGPAHQEQNEPQGVKRLTTLATLAADPAVDLQTAAEYLNIDLLSADLLGEVRRIEDPTGQAMSSFFEALTRTQNKEPGAVTRIVHYGDSLVVVDFMTGQIRRRLQGRFGDAGHGYMLIDKPWPWYQHWDIQFRTSGNWSIDGIMKAKSNTGRYGLGGYAFDGWDASQWVEFATDHKGEFGRQAGRFEVHYLVQPGGGQFRVLVDGAPQEPVGTDGPQVRSGVHVVQVPDGHHRFRVEVVKGPVRLFGGVLEREVPGVVYDTLGINGARARTLERIDPAFWAEQLRLRHPDLVIIHFGTNESEDTSRPLTQVEEDYQRILGQIRAATPDASCLVVTAPDRAARVEGQLTTKPIIPRLVATQRRAALKSGCAFYDTYEAMGGHGAMAQWYNSRPRLCAGDMTHPTRQGADLLGDGFYRAVVTGLVTHTGAMLQARASADRLATKFDPLLPDQPDPYPPLPEYPLSPY